MGGEVIGCIYMHIGPGILYVDFEWLVGTPVGWGNLSYMVSWFLLSMTFIPGILFCYLY